MVVTELTSHLDRCWLNTLLSRNIMNMVVTLEVSHRDMSALKALKDHLSGLWNSCDMSVTSDTSQSAISTVPAAPQSAPWLQHATPVISRATQLSTAVFSAARSGNAHTVSTPGAGSSPAALVPPPVQGAHSPFSTRSFSRHGLNTHAPGGPSVGIEPIRARLYGEPGVGAREHPRRVRVVGEGPTREVPVEAGGALKHTRRGCHLRHLPLADVHVEFRHGPGT